MRSKIVVLDASLTTGAGYATGTPHIVTVCQILSKRYDVVLACYSLTADWYKSRLSDDVKIVPIFVAQFQPSSYIVNQSEIEDFCKKKLRCDAALVYFSPFGSFINMYMKSFVNSRTIHVRNAQVVKNLLRVAVIRHTMRQAQKAAMYRVFDYWEVCDWTTFIGKPVQIFGLYEDKSFIYNNASMHLKYFPDMDYNKFIDGNVEVPNTKTRLMTFGYVNDGKTRKSFMDFCMKKMCDDPANKIFVHRKYKDRESNKKYNSLLLPQKYYAAIAQSKFTFIAPSTVETEVSVLRVNEAIRRKCIPLFHQANNIEKVYTPSDSEFIRSNLVFDDNKYSMVNDFVKALNLRYDELLAKVLELDFVKKGVFIDRK